jgi:hypothetical protein
VEKKEEKTPYDVEKKETALFTAVLILVLLMLLAFFAGSILQDLNIIDAPKLTKTAP